METQLWYAMTPDNECFINNEYGCTKPQTKPHLISTEKQKQFSYFLYSRICNYDCSFCQ